MPISVHAAAVPCAVVAAAAAAEQIAFGKLDGSIVVAVCAFIPHWHAAAHFSVRSLLVVQRRIAIFGFAVIWLYIFAVLFKSVCHSASCATAVDFTYVNIGLYSKRIIGSR